MTTQKTTILHRFRDLIGISFADTEQLYLTQKDALALSTELRRFAKNIDEKAWVTPRIVENGEAVTIRTGESEIEFV